MQPHEVEAIVIAVLAEQQRLHKDTIDDVVLRTVVNLLTSFGFEEDERKELKKDFVHLRKWRMSVDSATGITFKVAVTTIATGLVAAFVMFIKYMLGK